MERRSGLDPRPSGAYTERAMKSLTTRVLSLEINLLALPGLPGASAK